MIIRKQFQALDYLSYVGGSLGLLVGMSLLSFVEILYFLSLRLIVKFLNNKKVIKVQPFSKRIRTFNVKPILSKADELLNDFGSLKESSIHSFNVIGNTKKPFIERKVFVIYEEQISLIVIYFRLFWLLVITLSMMFCGNLISVLNEKLKSNPISVGLDDKLSKIDTVIFNTFSLHTAMIAYFTF